MGVNYLDFGREQKVELIEAAKGVYHVKGSDHHSMAVEMKDHVVLVEAPFFEERSVAVMKAFEEKQFDAVEIVLASLRTRPLRNLR